MRLDEFVRLRQDQLTERLAIAGDDFDALLLQRLDRLLFRLEPARSGVDRRFGRRSEELIAERRPIRSSVSPLQNTPSAEKLCWVSE